MRSLLEVLTVACTALAAWSGAVAQASGAKHQPTAAELSRDETPAKAIMRTFEFQQYDVRSAAEAMPEAKWDFRPSPGSSRMRSQNTGRPKCARFASK
jgi:hypothetical protein